MNYNGTIIEESLGDKNLLNKVKIVSTKIESVTEHHQTPWLKQWTLHKVEIKESEGDRIAELLSGSILFDPSSWYADYKNDTWHYIIFPGKIFKIEQKDKAQYNQARNYGISLGIPDYQVDFHPDIKHWER